MKEKQTSEIVQNIIDGIKSGKLSITELNNYGDEVTSYFTNSQLQSIADAYFEKTGKQLDIVTLEDFNNASGTKVTVDGEEVYTSNIKTKGAQKDTGYP